MEDNDEAAKSARRWERFKVTVRVHISYSRDGAKLESNGTAHDISIGGMALFLPRDLKVGESIRATFTLPYSDTLAITGIVRNRQSFEYGIEFVNPGPHVQQELTRNCRALALLAKE
jgi:c-di-GMP-binding flagellar brake protein YcgR